MELLANPGLVRKHRVQQTMSALTKTYVLQIHVQTGVYVKIYPLKMEQLVRTNRSATAMKPAMTATVNQACHEAVTI